MEDRKSIGTTSTDVNFDCDSIFNPDDLEITLKSELGLDGDTHRKEEEMELENRFNYLQQKTKGKGQGKGKKNVRNQDIMITSLGQSSDQSLTHIE